MNHYIDIQVACKDALPVSEEHIQLCAKTALQQQKINSELTLRFVDREEITYLNTTYRKKNGPTNVLAFPANLPEVVQQEYQLLGDVIICPEVLEKESQDLNKTLADHWAHIIIHGILHLLGYDHEEEQETEIMQQLERKLLAALHVEDPYLILEE